MQTRSHKQLRLKLVLTYLDISRLYCKRLQAAGKKMLPMDMTDAGIRHHPTARLPHPGTSGFGPHPASDGKQWNAIENVRTSSNVL